MSSGLGRMGEGGYPRVAVGLLLDLQQSIAVSGVGHGVGVINNAGIASARDRNNHDGSIEWN